VVVLMATAWLIGFFKVIDVVRQKLIPASMSKATVHLWEEEAEECENDVLALVVSFVLVQWLRFAVSGVLPGSHGEEPEGVSNSHTGAEIFSLFLIGAGFAVIGCGFVYARTFVETEFRLRVLEISQMTMMMTFCWCAFFGLTWAFAATELAETIGLREDSALMRVIVSITVSVLAFTLIFGLDKIADASTDARVNQVVDAFIAGNGVLVGFSWEQTFERSVGTITESVAIPKIVTKVLLAFVLVLLVLPAWRIWVVRRKLEAKPRE